MSNPPMYGQSNALSTRLLASDLKSPIALDTEVRWELIQTGAELWSSPTSFSTAWKITGSSGAVILQQTTASPVLRHMLTLLGSVMVEAEVLANGAATGTKATLQQEVIASDGSLVTLSSFSTPSGPSVATDRLRTWRELAQDFKDFIVEASRSQGISPRLLASILFIEVLNRPKAGREQELDEVHQSLITASQGGWLWPWNKINRSLGVGQIRLSTAAMVMGMTPWIEQDRADRDAARDTINSNFERLTSEQKFQLYTWLRWPRSNIHVAARLVGKLKNRPHRYPALSAADFIKDETAVGVVATEYNSGATNTPQGTAQPANYGRWAWGFINDPGMVAYFPEA